VIFLADQIIKTTSRSTALTTTERPLEQKGLQLLSE